jgi:hypothetical protein
MKTILPVYNSFLKELAKRAGLTNSELSQLTGIPIGTIGCYFATHVNIPVHRYNLIEKACKDRLRENQEFIEKTCNG